MSEEVPNVKIVFPDSFDDRSRLEMTSRGCLINVLVEVEDGNRYRVEFIDPVRLAQEMEDNVKLNIPCYAEPGLIILPEVTVVHIQKAVRYLYIHGFFESLTPINN